jgi:hypothetical protein
VHHRDGLLLLLLLLKLLLMALQLLGLPGHSCHHSDQGLVCGRKQQTLSSLYTKFI